MMRFLLAVAMLGLLTACPSEGELESLMADLSQKKAQAAETIRKRDFSIDGLLAAQDYFFDFAERTALLRGNDDAVSNTRSFIESTGVSEFCARFVIPIRSWKILQADCSKTQPYRCSPDMNDYQTAYNAFLRAMGPEITRRFHADPRCN